MRREIAAEAERLLRAALPEARELSVHFDLADPALFDPNDPVLQLAAGAFERACGTPPAFVRIGGTLPLLSVLAEQGVPTIVSGFALGADAFHAPNESYRLESLRLGELTAGSCTAHWPACRAKGRSPTADKGKVGVPKRHLKAVDGSGFAQDPWEQRFRLLAGSVRALVSVHDAAGAFLYASPLVSELTGVPRDTLLGSPVQALIHPEDAERVMALHRGWMRGPGAETVEYRLLSAGGGWCPVETTFVAGDVAEVQWVTRRLDLVGAEPQTAAEIDPATGLPTRYSLLDRLAWALHPAGSRRRRRDRDPDRRPRADRRGPRPPGHQRGAPRARPPHLLRAEAARPRRASSTRSGSRPCARACTTPPPSARIAERILDVAKRPIGPGGLPVDPERRRHLRRRRPAPSRRASSGRP